jgi:hypothetical protein
MMAKQWVDRAEMLAAIDVAIARYEAGVDNATTEDGASAWRAKLVTAHVIRNELARLCTKWED